MPRRSKPSPEQPAPSASFEEALADLESIIEAMEHEQLPLEDLVAYYEKGSSLLNHCEGILQSARGRIELITLRNNQPGNDPATPQTTHTTDEPAPPEDDGFDGATEESDDDPDDIRLF